MTRKRLFWVSAILLGIVLVLPVSVFAQADSLKIEDIDIPVEIFKGDLIEVELQLSGDKADEELSILMCAIEQGSDVDIEGEIIQKGECPEDTVSQSSNATLIAPPEGNYILGIGLFEEDDSQNKILPGLAASTVDFTVSSPLPDSVSRLIAGLGIFAAMMAVMAAGTEVVIDSVKGFFGLKRKVTALEAFQELQEQLPGQLKALGVEKGKVLEFEEFTKETRTALDDFANQLDWSTLFANYLSWERILALEPFKQIGANLFSGLQQALENVPGMKANTAQDLITSIKKRSILDFSPDQLNSTLDTLIEGMGIQTKKDVEQILADQLTSWLQANLLSPQNKDQLKNFLSAWIAPFKDQVPFLKRRIEQFEKKIIEEIDQWQPEDLTFESLKKAFEGILTFLSNTTAEQISTWLEEKVDVFSEKGRESLDIGLGFLKKLGLPTSVITTLEKELDKIETLIDLDAQTFITSARNLLESVEQRRNDIQSPIRKFWRWLRGTSKWSLWMMIFVILLLWNVWGTWKPMPLSWWHSELLLYWWIIIGLTIIVIVVGLYSWGSSNENKQIFVRYLYLLLGIALTLVVPFIIPLDWPLWQKAIYTLVALLLLGWLDYTIGWDRLILGSLIRSIEISVNRYIKGQDEIEATILGQPDQNMMDEIQGIAQTTLASALLKLENTHVDQEKSRLRWMRVMALLIGTILAFLLQIDALILLKEAFPTLDISFNQDLEWKIFARSHEIFGYWPTPGIVLTGLAASAGSKFWHDFLGRLEATKKTSENVAKTVQNIKRSMPGVGDQ